MDYYYAQEKLYIAIRSLATNNCTIHERILNAFMSFHTLREEDFPDEYKEDWKWIMDQITKKGPVMSEKNDVLVGSVENTLAGLDNSVAVEIATKIFDIAWDLCTNEKYK